MSGGLRPGAYVRAGLMSWISPLRALVWGLCQWAYVGGLRPGGLCLAAYIRGAYVLDFSFGGFGLGVMSGGLCPGGLCLGDFGARGLRCGLHMSRRL